MQDEYLVKLDAPVERHELFQVARRLARDYNLDVMRVEDMFAAGGGSLTLVLPESQAKHVQRLFHQAGLDVEVMRQPRRAQWKAFFFPGGHLAPRWAVIMLCFIVLISTGFLLWPHLQAAGPGVAEENATSPVTSAPEPDDEEAGEGALDTLPVAQVSVFDAVVRREMQSLQELIHAGHEVDVRDPYGQTPLMYAVDHHDEEAVRVLLAAGAHVDARSAAGWTALMYAARNLQATDLLQVLLDAGADLTLRNDQGQSARDLAVIHNHTAAVALLDATAADRAVGTAPQGTSPQGTPPQGAPAQQVTARQPAALGSLPSRQQTSRQTLLNCLRNWEACGTD
jgi:hypothetical protein